MAKALYKKLFLTIPTRRDIKEIARWTYLEFGESATLRYIALTTQVLKDIDDDPYLKGSQEIQDSLGRALRTYHFALSKSKVAGGRVQSPRHIVLYLPRADGVIEILRILHDSQDISRHFPSPMSR